MTDAQVAAQWGIARSTLSAVKNRRRRFSDRTVQRIAESRSRLVEVTDRRGRPTGEFVAKNLDRISYGEAERLSVRGGSPRTQRLALEVIERIERENPGRSVAELRNIVTERPTFIRTIRGQRIRIPLGRSRSDEFQARAERELKAKGVDVDALRGDGEYLDLGGYGGQFSGGQS